jgi:hypothetical protein
VVGETLTRVGSEHVSELAQVLEADAYARAIARGLVADAAATIRGAAS